MLRKIEKNIFISPTKGKMTIDQIADELLVFINEEPDYFYRLVIGTDSKSNLLNGEQKVNFVSAIVIHRQGKGGRYFWRKKKVANLKSLRDKIYTETLLSIHLAEELMPYLTRRLNGEKYQLEIHIDVGKAGPTREMIKEVVGMVNGNGFIAKTKPESYGAFVVADKHT